MQQDGNGQSAECVSVGGPGRLLKVKDWPPAAHFKQELPEHMQVCSVELTTVTDSNSSNHGSGQSHEHPVKEPNVAHGVVAA
jgi:hypothetical protein